MEPAGIDRRLSPNIIMDHILIQNLGLMAAALVTAVVLGQIIIPNILLVSFRKRLFDMPDPRKVHHNLVPRLGGVSFFPVVLFCVCLFIGLRILLGGTVESLFPPGTTPELLLFTAGLTLLYIVGVADDLIGVRYFKKFIVQLFAALMLPLSELYINNLYGLFGIYDLSPFLGIPLTLLLVVFITNAINLIDGIDGLASGLSMVALAVFGGLFNLLWMVGICIGGFCEHRHADSVLFIQRLRECSPWTENIHGRYGQPDAGISTEPFHR